MVALFCKDLIGPVSVRVCTSFHMTLAGWTIEAWKEAKKEKAETENHSHSMDPASFDVTNLDFSRWTLSFSKLYHKLNLSLVKILINWSRRSLEHLRVRTVNMRQTVPIQTLLIPSLWSLSLIKLYISLRDMVYDFFSYLFTFVKMRTELLRLQTKVQRWPSILSYFTSCEDYIR